MRHSKYNKNRFDIPVSRVIISRVTMSPTTVRNRVLNGSLSEAICTAACEYLNERFEEELDEAFNEAVEARSGEYDEDDCGVLSIIDFIDIVFEQRKLQKEWDDLDATEVSNGGMDWWQHAQQEESISSRMEEIGDILHQSYIPPLHWVLFDRVIQCK